MTVSPAFALVALLLALAGNCLAQMTPHVDPRSTGSTLSLSEVRDRLDSQIRALRNIVMHEEVSRYVSTGGRSRKIDQFDALVEVSEGSDSYTSLRRNGHLVENPGIISGAWSFGEFSSLLKISREALGGQSAKVFQDDTAAGSAPLRAEFRYPASSARWFVSVDSRLYWLEFSGVVSFSPETGQAQTITWTSAQLDPETGIAQIQRTVRFAPFQVCGETFVLPDSAEYRVVYSNDRVEWNVTRFKEPSRYGSQVAVNFGQ